MVEAIKGISDGVPEPNKVAELQRVASEVASGLHSKRRVIGKVTLLEKSELLSPQGYKAADVGTKAFETQGRSYNWCKSKHFEGMLKDRCSTKLPDDHFLIWIIKDGDLYLKWVQGRYEQMKDEIRAERADLSKRMYWTSVKRNFKKMLEKL